MNAEIKERIKMINNGEVPEGYKKTKLGIIPEDWKIKRLDTLGTFGKNYPYARNVEGEGDYYYIHYGDIHSKYNGYVNCETDVPNIKINEKHEILKPNDIVIADASEDYKDLGKTIIIKGTINKKIIAGLHTFKFTPSENLSSTFYLYYTQSKSYKKFVSKMGSGISVYGLSKRNLSKMNISLPLICEQQKIAHILSTWDNAIELKGNLLELKKEQKKGLMQNLLTEKIRLLGFEGKWEETKLGGICVIKKGKQLNKEHLTDIGNYYALNGGINPSGYTDDWNTRENTISISEGGESCGYVRFNYEKFWSGGHCYTLSELSNKINHLFLYQMLKKKEKDIMRLRVGSGLPNIQIGTLSKFLIELPPLPEQKAIANILSTADKEIELLNEELELLKEQKRGLMQLLLTGIVRVQV